MQVNVSVSHRAAESNRYGSQIGYARHKLVLHRLPFRPFLAV